MMFCNSTLNNLECSYDSINKKFKFIASNFLNGPFLPSFSISLGCFNLVASTNFTSPFTIIYMSKTINGMATVEVKMDLVEFDGKH